MKKNKMRGLAVFVFSMAIITAIGCEGPEGPTGPQGAQGPQGDQGVQGTQGDPGTANVIYSGWIVLSDLEAPTDTSVLGRSYMKYNIPASDLTQEIIDMGTILVYFRLTGTVLQLPTSFGGADPIYITFSPFVVGTLSILSQNLVSNTSTGLNSTIEFRYIFIPGGVAANKENLPDFNNYNAVVEYYGIDP